MQYDAHTPAEYLACLEDDWRRATILHLREVIAGIAPDWVEGIGHGMLQYSSADGPVLHLNAQKKYVGLYVGDVAALDPDGTLLAGIDCGKSCIRLKKLKRPDPASLRLLIQRQKARHEAGLASAC